MQKCVYNCPQFCANCIILRDIIPGNRERENDKTRRREQKLPQINCLPPPSHLSSERANIHMEKSNHNSSSCSISQIWSIVFVHTGSVYFSPSEFNISKVAADIAENELSPVLPLVQNYIYMGKCAHNCPHIIVRTALCKN